MRKLKRFNRNNKRNIMLVIGVILIVGLVVSANLIKSHANFNTSKSFNVIRGKIPSKNNGDIKLAIKLDGQTFKDENENGKSIFPTTKGHKYIKSECSNNEEAVVSVVKNNDKWDVTVKTDKPVVCALYFQSYTTDNLIKVLKEKNELVTFNHEDTVQTGSNTKTDYRYVGSSPNNYVKFNNELWRIIGIFNTDDGTGKWEERVKIVRNVAVSDKKWDDDGKTDWENASFQKWLNNDYYNGLNNDSKNLISKATWYTSSFNIGHSTSYDISSEEAFKKERSGEPSTGSNDCVKFLGVMGLPYSSDFLNMMSDSTDLSSSWSPDCFTASLNPIMKDYMYIGWLWVPSLGSWYTNETIAGLPTTYLVSDAKVDLTTRGTIDNPYELSLE